MNALPIILDTDIGNDPDDVLALAMALDRDEFDIRGIITTGSDPELRAGFARHLCEIAGKPDIPVAVGAPVEGGDAPTDLHRQYFLAHGMTEALDSIITPHELLTHVAADTILVTIGPLMTFAAFLRANDGALPDFAGVVSMGGFVSRRKAKYVGEFNFGQDPAATRTVLAHDFQHLCVTKNVCHGVYMQAEDLVRLDAHNSPARKWAFDFMKEWFGYRDKKIYTTH